MLRKFLKTTTMITMSVLLGGVPAAATLNHSGAAVGVEPDTALVYEERPIHDPRRLAQDYLAWLPYSDGVTIEFTDLNPDAEKVAAEGAAVAGFVPWADPSTIHIDASWVDSMSTWGDAPRLYSVVLHELVHTQQMADGQPTIPAALDLVDFERSWISLRDDDWPEGADDVHKSIEIAAACIQEHHYPGTAYYVTGACPTPLLVASLEWFDELGGGTAFMDQYWESVLWSVVGHAVIGYGV